MSNSGLALMGVSVSETHTTAQHELGTEAQADGNKYRYVRAGAAIAAGDAVVRDTSSADEPNVVIPSSALNQALAGVAHVAIASGSFGWITVRGRVAAGKVAAGTAAGAQLGTSGTAGTLSTITVSGTPTQAEVQRVLAAASGLPVQALDAEASGFAELFVG